MEALVEMNKGTVLPPDANSTMRITYGTVGGYSPKDGVTYDYRSSIDGYKEKYVENDPEFDLNPDCWAAIQKETGDVMPIKTENFIPDSPRISTSQEEIPAVR